MTNDKIMVSLVGAGPGDPDLLTLKAVERLRHADLVLYDRLVPAGLLDHAPQSARRVCVDELAGCHPDRWPHIHRMMIEGTRSGFRVVRLKGGDPFVFGRGGEEAEALRDAGVAFEVVPGVTAALGAAACAGIPLTHRLHASAVAFVTGHELPGKEGARLDWAALARFPGTLVFYMGIAKLREIVRALLDHGKPADTPAAVVRWAATSSQTTLEAALGQIPEVVQRADMKAPAIVIVGPVVGLRSQLKWFENRPLFGRCVLVTRPRHQAGDMVRQLKDLGATAVSFPLVEIRDPEDWAPVDAALARLADYQWLVFTSANGVHALIRRLTTIGQDLRALGHLRLAVIGPATGEALRTFHLTPDLMPSEFNSEGLAGALAAQVRGKKVLLARADRGVDVLREQLGAMAIVDQVAVYSQVDSARESGHVAMGNVEWSEIDFVTLTSSNIARAFVQALNTEAKEQINDGRVQLVTISPRTSAAVREMGLPVAAEAREYTTQGVIQALCKLESVSLGRHP
jgi:uroporphyrinogen III methyltransferase/synthase